MEFDRSETASDRILGPVIGCDKEGERQVHLLQPHCFPSPKVFSVTLVHQSAHTRIVVSLFVWPCER